MKKRKNSHQNKQGRNVNSQKQSRKNAGQPEKTLNKSPQGAEQSKKNGSQPGKQSQEQVAKTTNALVNPETK